jgi:hypothetical protein
LNDLASLEIALRRDRAYARLGETHVHRVTREDSLRIIKGRDAITAAWVDTGEQHVTIDHDMGDMVAYTVNDAWQGHKWVCREDGRILREVVIEDTGAPCTAPPVHSPLGELRAGRGQYAAGDTAVLPPDFPEAARDSANRLHASWNGRAFDVYNAEWLTNLVRTLPDASFQFERAIVHAGKTALLWRVMGHHAGGQRIRLIGSSIFDSDSDDTVIDTAALSAQIERSDIIRY